MSEAVVEVGEPGEWNDQQNVRLADQLYQAAILQSIRSRMLQMDVIAVAVDDFVGWREEQSDGETKAHYDQGDIVNLVSNATSLVVVSTEPQIDRRRYDTAHLLESNPASDAPSAPLIARIANDDGSLSGPKQSAEQTAEDRSEDQEPLDSILRVAVHRGAKERIPAGSECKCPLDAEESHDGAAEDADDAHETKVDRRGGIGDIWLLLASTAESLEGIEASNGAECCARDKENLC